MADAVETSKNAAITSRCGPAAENNFTVDESQGFIFVRFEKGAEICSKDIYGALRSLMAIDGGRFLDDVWDMRGAGMGSDVGFRQMATMVRRLGALVGDRWRAKTAIVTDNSEVFGVMRIYQTMASDLPTKVELFEDLQEALAWLRE